MAAKAHEQITASTWCQGWMARDDAGHYKGVWEETACRRCLSGWLIWTYGPSTQRYERAWKKVAKALLARGEAMNPMSWNDQPGRTAEEVRELLKEAGV